MTTSLYENDKSSGYVPSWLTVSKWRDVRAYLAGKTLELPGCVREFGAGVLNALACSPNDPNAVEYGEPVALANLNGTHEREQDELIAAFLGNLPGVVKENVVPLNTTYDVRLTSAIGEHMLRFSRSEVPSVDNAADLRIIYSLTTSAREPLE